MSEYNDLDNERPSHHFTLRSNRFKLKITSLQNPRVKAVRALHKSSVRQSTGQFSIEGLREQTHALRSDVPIQSVWYCPAKMNSAEHWTYLNRVGSLPGVETYEINESILEKIAYRENPDGLLTIAKNPNIDLRDLDAANVSLVLVADRTEKPSNLGTMIRSADAVNCDLVLVSDAVIDLFNPNVIRASIGTIFCVPVVATSGNKVRHWFSENKIQVVTASPAASHDYTQFDFKARSAIVVGNESLGLDDAWFDAAASNVCLPVLGSGDSINAAQCATVLLFEALRQRRSA